MAKEKKKGGIGKIIGIVIAVIVVLCILFGGEDETPSKVGSVDSESQQDASKDETQEQTKSNRFVVGDIVETKELRISYLRAQEYQSNNEFIQPDDGNVYYRMEFEVENISDEDQYVSSMMDWECYADGYVVKQEYIGDDDLSATLSAGKKAKGALYFQLPKDAKSIELEYDITFYGNEKIVFVVK